MFDYETGQIDRITSDDPDQRYLLKVMRGDDAGIERRIETHWLTIGSYELAALRAIFARRES